jgi:hypothetical protein
MTVSTQNALGKLLGFLSKLEDDRISFRLQSVRDAIMVEIVVPGERWEVEFFEDGQVELERFISTGRIENEHDLEEQLLKHIDS